jgi:hypothetical protein
MDQVVQDAIAIFYKLKGRYDKEGDKIKQKIINRDDLTMAEKRDLFQTQKRKCINCKRPVGTIFKTTKDEMVALCGAQQRSDGGDGENVPCNLDIKIIKGDVVQLPNYVSELKKTHEKLITAIMKVKYNLLFKYANEEETVSDFEKSKDEFDKNATLYDLYKTKLIQITSLLEKRERISVTDLQLTEFVKETKDFVEESVQTGNVQLIKDVVELYITRIMDVLRENRELKYSYQGIEETDAGEFKLVQVPVTMEDTEMVIGKGFKVDRLVLKK